MHSFNYSVSFCSFLLQRHLTGGFALALDKNLTFGPSLLGKATDDLSADDLTHVVHSCRVLPFVLVTSDSFCKSSDPSP